MQALCPCRGSSGLTHTLVLGVPSVPPIPPHSCAQETKPFSDQSPKQTELLAGFPQHVGPCQQALARLTAELSAKVVAGSAVAYRRPHRDPHCSRTPARPRGSSAKKADPPRPPGKPPGLTCLGSSVLGESTRCRAKEEAVRGARGGGRGWGRGRGGRSWGGVFPEQVLPIKPWRGKRAEPLGPLSPAPDAYGFVRVGRI